MRLRGLVIGVVVFWAQFSYAQQHVAITNNQTFTVASGVPLIGTYECSSGGTILNCPFSGASLVDPVITGTVTGGARYILADGTNAAPGTGFVSSTTTGFNWRAGDTGTAIDVDMGGVSGMTWALDPGSPTTGMRINLGDGQLGFAGGPSSTTPIDARFVRDAANTIQMGADAASPSDQRLKGPDSTGGGGNGGALILDGGAKDGAGSAGNVKIATSRGKAIIGINGTAISRVLYGSGTLDFANIGSTPACSTDLTIALTGATDGDVCTVGPPAASVTAATQFTCWVSSADTVSVRACAFTGSNVNPGSGTYKVMLVQN